MSCVMRCKGKKTKVIYIKLNTGGTLLVRGGKQGIGDEHPCMKYSTTAAVDVFLKVLRTKKNMLRGDETIEKI